MQDNGMFEATFNSSVEFDIKLKRKNGEIYVFSGGNHKIPEKYVLCEINGEPFHAAEYSSIEDLQKQVIKSKDVYPLTLKFNKNYGLQKCASQHSLKLPVPDDFFGDYLDLTSEEAEQYKKLAESWVDGLMEAEYSTEGYSYVCTKDNVEIYQGKVPGSKIHLIRGKSKIRATKEEMKAMMISSSTDSFRRLFHVIDVHFYDGVLMHLIPKDYKHPDVPFYSIKWGVFGQAGPVSLRDVCWLEYGDIRVDENGKEYGFGVGSSIKRPECPELSHLNLVRAEMLCSGYVFRQSDQPDILDVTYIIQADPKGWLPIWAINLFAWQEALNLARIRSSCEGIMKAMKKIDRLHDRQGAAVQGVLVPRSQFYDVHINVDVCGSLIFGFCSEKNNISFHLLGVPDDNNWAVNKRYDCNLNPVYGKVSVTKGKYALHLDNTFSWLTSKMVYYWYEVIV
ncbi:uncharacterized protein LOC124435774 [Xenia sp. Carnegie-2017]|uniref:uncharacterized protein LOC124435774 n=1 Tax=Xenia sp. Carnegie-2017 TaxID=2897299 RepID=UPI001F03ACBD|nr:uncharacterized protein LOC124435774 [Xenia sp. Carnegie-2017]